MFQINCADYGCLPSDVKRANHQKNVPIVHGINAVAGQRLIKHRNPIRPGSFLE